MVIFYYGLLHTYLQDESYFRIQIKTSPEFAPGTLDNLLWEWAVAGVGCIEEKKIGVDAWGMGATAFSALPDRI